LDILVLKKLCPTGLYKYFLFSHLLLLVVMWKILSELAWQGCKRTCYLWTLKEVYFVLGHEAVSGWNTRVELSIFFLKIYCLLLCSWKSPKLVNTEMLFIMEVWALILHLLTRIFYAFKYFYVYIISCILLKINLNQSSTLCAMASWKRKIDYLI
jgi:hypothetical protein